MSPIEVVRLKSAIPFLKYLISVAYPTFSKSLRIDAFVCARVAFIDIEKSSSVNQTR